MDRKYNKDIIKKLLAIIDENEITIENLKLKMALNTYNFIEEIHILEIKDHEATQTIEKLDKKLFDLRQVIIQLKNELD